jgi:hypothetical protein
MHVNVMVHDTFFESSFFRPNCGETSSALYDILGV